MNIIQLLMGRDQRVTILCKSQDQPYQAQEACWCPGKRRLAGLTVLAPKPTQKQPQSPVPARRAPSGAV